jgi:hypothetical protein
MSCPQRDLTVMQVSGRRIAAGYDRIRKFKYQKLPDFAEDMAVMEA